MNGLKMYGYWSMGPRSGHIHSVELQEPHVGEDARQREPAGVCSVYVYMLVYACRGCVYVFVYAWLRECMHGCVSVCMVA